MRRRMVERRQRTRSIERAGRAIVAEGAMKQWVGMDWQWVGGGLGITKLGGW
jgi:hypothetical protein